MLNEMSEAQRLMLQAAAAREDRYLQPPSGIGATVAFRLTSAIWRTPPVHRANRERGSGSF